MLSKQLYWLIIVPSFPSLSSPWFRLSKIDELVNHPNPCVFGDMTFGEMVHEGNNGKVHYQIVGSTGAAISWAQVSVSHSCCLLALVELNSSGQPSKPAATSAVELAGLFLQTYFWAFL